MFKRKIIQKRVIALVLAIVLLAAIPILTASAVTVGEKGATCTYPGCGKKFEVTLFPIGPTPIRCYVVRYICDQPNHYYESIFYSHEGRPNQYGLCNYCNYPY